MPRLLAANAEALHAVRTLHHGLRTRLRVVHEVVTEDAAHAFAVQRPVGELDEAIVLGARQHALGDLRVDAAFAGLVVHGALHGKQCDVPQGALQVPL